MKLFRRVLLTALLASIVIGSGCVRNVRVAQLLPLQPAVPSVELVNRINRYGKLNTLASQVLIDVTDYLTGSDDTARKPPEANGALRLERPDKIRMLVTAPIVNSNVADMASNGNEFALALYYPSDKKAFVHGTTDRLKHVNAAELKEARDPRLKQAGGLANIRPQHITDAFLIAPITDKTEYFTETDVEVEPDTRPGKAGRTVKRTYYILYVLAREENGKLFPNRKFWFDRTTPGTPLVRQEVFRDGDGVVATDITYRYPFFAEGSDVMLPGSVTISRPTDGYDIQITLVKGEVQVNTELPATAFVLENREHLKDIDLDQPLKTQLNSEGANLRKLP